MLRCLIRWLSAGIPVVALTGCHGLAQPNFFHPGPAALQRNQARRFDPFPESDLGPSMEEARPPDYQQGMPVPTRSRWTIGS
jgi:hypothetical protein